MLHITNQKYFYKYFFKFIINVIQAILSFSIYFIDLISKFLKQEVRYIQKHV